MFKRWDLCLSRWNFCEDFFGSVFFLLTFFLSVRRGVKEKSGHAVLDQFLPPSNSLFFYEWIAGVFQNVICFCMSLYSMGEEWRETWERRCGGRRWTRPLWELSSEIALTLALIEGLSSHRAEGERKESVWDQVKHTGRADCVWCVCVCVVCFWVHFK